MAWDQQIENVARAFYIVNCGQSWDQEPEFVKRQYRKFARDAVALLTKHQSEVREAIMVPELA